MTHYSKEENLRLNAERGILVDPWNMHFLEEYSWVIGTHGYACRDEGTLLLHHEIRGKPPQGMVVDHISRNTRNNCLYNLRVVPHRINQMNVAGQSPIRSAYRSRDNTYRVSLYIGTFDNEDEGIEEAQRAVDAMRIGGYRFGYET